MGRVIVRNTLFAAGGQFVSAGVSFLATPYIVYKLKTEGYGVWALMSVVTGYAGLLDLGVKAAFTKYVAEYKAKADEKALQGVVGTGLVFYTALGILVFALVYVLRDPLLRLLNVPVTLYEQASFALLCSVAAFCVSNVFSAFWGVIEGLQRMDVSRSVGIGTSVGTTGAMVVVLALGGALKEMAEVALVSAILGGFLVAVCAFRVSPVRIGLTSLKIDKEMFKRLAGFGLKLQGANLSSVGNLHLDKLLLAHFWNVRLVTFYELGLRATMMLRSLPLLLVTAIVPAASDLQARGEKDRLALLYERGMKYLAAATYPFILLPLVLSSYLVGAWMGLPEYSPVVRPLQFLALAHCFNVLTGLPNMIARGLGLLNYEMVTGFGFPCVHLGLALILVPRYGMAGALGGATAAVVGVSVLSLLWVHAGTKVSPKPFARLWWEAHAKPCAAALLATATVYLISLLGKRGVGAPSTRLDYIGWVMVLSCVFVVLYCSVLSQMRFLDRDDLRAFPFLRRIPLWGAKLQASS